MTLMLAPSNLRRPTAKPIQAAIRSRGPVCKSVPPKFQVALNQHRLASKPQVGRSLLVCQACPSRF